MASASVDDKRKSPGRSSEGPPARLKHETMFQTVGRVAGLAGIVIVVLLLIYQGAIQFFLRSKVDLQPEIAGAVLYSVVTLTFGIAAIGVVAWLISVGMRHRGTNFNAHIYAICVLTAFVLLVSAGIGFFASQRGPSEAAKHADAKEAPKTDPKEAPKAEAKEPLKTTHTEFTVCLGQYPSGCPAGAVLLGCGANIQAWAAAQCLKYSITKMSDVPGNMCGYYTARVFCEKQL